MRLFLWFSNTVLTFFASLVDDFSDVVVATVVTDSFLEWFSTSFEITVVAIFPSSNPVFPDIKDLAKMSHIWRGMTYSPWCPCDDKLDLNFDNFEFWYGLTWLCKIKLGWCNKPFSTFGVSLDDVSNPMDILNNYTQLVSRLINLFGTVFWKSRKKSHSTLRAKRATFTFWVDKS